MVVTDVLGWAGAVLLIAAYAGVSGGRLSGTSLVFQGCNAVGSACLVANTVSRGAFPSSVVNAIWLVIASRSILRVIMSRRT